MFIHKMKVVIMLCYVFNYNCSSNIKPNIKNYNYNCHCLTRFRSNIPTSLDSPIKRVYNVCNVSKNVRPFVRITIFGQKLKSQPSAKLQKYNPAMREVEWWLWMKRNIIQLKNDLKRSVTHSVVERRLFHIRISQKRY